jgi:proteasome lid subunit RPN8/RPN11
MKLNKNVIETIYQHSLEEYPEECCGVVTGKNDGQRVHRCRNVQNQLHAENPERYPRDARTAYVIERSEFDSIIKSAQDSGEDIIAFYHSHCDHDAYFSEEDYAAQTVFGEPEFPDALHVVVSVKSGKVYKTNCFLWDRETGRFITANSSI